MHAADTNLWVRYLTNDDPPAAARVVAWLAATQHVHLPVTVLLELEWVLRAAYRLDRSQVQAGLRHVVGLPQVAVAEARAVALALELHSKGLDFADALHVALLPEGTTLVTLDEALVKDGGAAGLSVALV